MGLCINCNAINKRKIYKYCTNKCQRRYEHEQFIIKWRNGDIKVVGKNISGYLRHYLIEKYKERCSLCGWKERNGITGKVPLEVDHIDGNANNNAEINLRIICPNCHSLTPNFRNLNKGSGRIWRRNSYINIT